MNSLARYTPDNHWGQPELLDSGMEHKLAVGSNGDAIAVWRTALDLRASIFSPDIGWGHPATIHAGDNNVFEFAENPEVAVNDFGDAFVVWMHDGIDNQGIWGKHYNAKSGWDEAVEIMKLPISGTPSTPVIVMDNENNAAAAWEQYSGSSRVWVSIYK